MGDLYKDVVDEDALMKFRDISLSKSLTIPLSTKFHSHRVEFGMSVDLEDGEDYDEAVAKLSQIINQQLAKEINQLSDTPQVSKNADTPQVSKNGKKVLMETDS